MHLSPGEQEDANEFCCINNIAAYLQGPDSISFNADGSFSILQFGVGNFEKRCGDWADRNTRCIAWNKEIIGESTPDRKEVDVMIIWSDCDRVVIDTGYIHMWREW